MANSSVEQQEKTGFQNVVRLGYVSLFTDVSTEMILGVLPFFIIKDLGGTVGILGFIEGIAEALNYAFRVLAGILTDRIGRRKPLVLLGYGLSTIAKPLFAFSTSWIHAFAVRLSDRAGKGIRTSPRDALISDSAPKSKAGRAFGLHRSLDQLGAILGPIIAFSVIPFIGIRGVFWISFIPAAAALFILLFLVRDVKISPRRRGVFENARKVVNRKFAFLMLVLTIFSIGAYNFSFVLLKAGALGLSDNYIPLVYSTLNVATVIAGFPAGVLADKIGKLKVLGLAYVSFLVTSIAGLLLAGNQIYGFLIALLFGSYIGISETVQRAVIPDFTEQDLKGTAYAIYYTLIGVGSLIANSIFGVLWSSAGETVAFGYSIAASATALVALVIFVKSK